MDNLEDQLSNSYGQLNELSNEHLNLLFDDLYTNLNKSRAFECGDCNLCQFKFIVIETYIFNNTKNLLNRRDNHLSKLAQNYLIDKYDFPK